jgi:hypothetical protein
MNLLIVTDLLGHLGALPEGTEVSFGLLLEEGRKISPDIIDMRIDAQSQQRIACDSSKVVWSRFPTLKLKQDIATNIHATLTSHASNENNSPFDTTELHH